MLLGWRFCLQRAHAAIAEQMFVRFLALALHNGLDCGLDLLAGTQQSWFDQLRAAMDVGRSLRLIPLLGLIFAIGQRECVLPLTLRAKPIYGARSIQIGFRRECKSVSWECIE